MRTHSPSRSWGAARRAAARNAAPREWLDGGAESDGERFAGLVGAGGLRRPRPS
ncbi:hypothetical protein GWI34_31245 [Actinomadura sp. DSM 109109]|nr:hypothetical protein [Actinomadura lepetitiana]